LAAGAARGWPGRPGWRSWLTGTVVTQVKNGQWQRVYPSQAGTFDCEPGNLVTVNQTA
jgi:hypothetical protein